MTTTHTLLETLQELILYLQLLRVNLVIVIYESRDGLRYIICVPYMDYVMIT